MRTRTIPALRDDDDENEHVVDDRQIESDSGRGCCASMACTGGDGARRITTCTCTATDTDTGRTGTLLLAASANLHDNDNGRRSAASPRRPSQRLPPRRPPVLRVHLPPLLPPLLLLLLLLLLTLQGPTPASATLYLHSTSSDGHAVAIPYPSEPARFGRAFDGSVTGPGNLFLPPRGVDSRLCSVNVEDGADEGVGSRADGNGGDGGGGGDGEGTRRLLDLNGRYHHHRGHHGRHHGRHQHQHQRRHQHQHRRRLLDQTMDGDDTVKSRELGYMDLPPVLETEAEEVGARIANDDGGENDDGENDDDDDDEEYIPESTNRLRHRYLMASSGGNNMFGGGGGGGDDDDNPPVGGGATRDDDVDNRDPRRQRRDLHEQYDDGTDSRGNGSNNAHHGSSIGNAYSSPATSRASSAGLDQPRPLALLVERGGCTFHEKAMNAMRLNRRLLREAVLLSRDGYGLVDDVNGGGEGGDGNADVGDEEDDGANRKRVYEFPDKGDADMGNDGNDADDNGNGRRLKRRMDSHRTLQPNAAATDTYDQEAIIEQGLDSVQRDMDKSEVGTARPSDLIGDGGSPSSGYGTNGGMGNGNNNIFVELPTLRIDYLVVYNDEDNSAHGKEDYLVLMDPPSDTQDVDRVDVGLVFISRRSGLDLRRRMNELSSTGYGTTVPWPSGLTTDYDNESDGDGEDNVPAYYLTARDMFPSTATENGGWSLPISVDQKKELGPYGTTGWPRGSTPRDSFYWIRFVLIALLIVTPVMRGCFVWHGAGGRVQFRRNDAGRIVGLHIVRPTGSWITGWDDGPFEEGDAERRRDRIRKMTQDQVMGLPEIEYTASTDDDTDEGNGEDNVDDLEGGDATTSKDLEDINISSSDSRSQEPEASASGNESAISSDDNSPATKTTCTSCSICIDDFEPGEKIRLLPRCGHAFHTDCILPWLTERSGSCPLCKRNVMGDGTDGLEESSAEEHDSNSIIDGGNDAEEGAIENEDEDVEESRAGNSQRPQDSRETRESISSSGSNGTIRISNSARTRRARRRRRNGLDAGA